MNIKNDKSYIAQDKNTNNIKNNFEVKHQLLIMRLLNCNFIFLLYISQYNNKLHLDTLAFVDPILHKFQYLFHIYERF